MDQKDLEEQVLNVLRLMGKMKSDKFAFEEGIKISRRLEELGKSGQTNLVDSFFERFITSYADYSKAYLGLPKDIQKLVDYDILPPYYRLDIAG